jgi:hypothetical protein
MGGSESGKDGDDPEKDIPHDKPPIRVVFLPVVRLRPESHLMSVIFFIFFMT